MTVTAQQAVASGSAMRVEGAIDLDNATLLRRFGRILDAPGLIAVGCDRVHRATDGHPERPTHG